MGYCPWLVRGGHRTGALPTMVGCRKPLSPCHTDEHSIWAGREKTSRMLGGRANAERQRSPDLLAWCDSWRSSKLFSTSQSSRSCPFQSASICFVVLIVRSRSALLRAIWISFFITMCMYMCVCSLILLLQKGHRCSAGYLRNQWHMYVHTCTNKYYLSLLKKWDFAKTQNAKLKT